MNLDKSSWLEADAVERVAIALGGDAAGAAIEECRIRDVKHVVRLLAQVVVLEDLAPGFVASMFDTFIPHFMGERDRQIVKAESQRRADVAGFGKQWSAAIEAGTSPRAAGFKAAIVEAFMAAHKCTEQEAVRKTAAHYGIDEESLRRTMRRHRAAK